MDVDDEEDDLPSTSSSSSAASTKLDKASREYQAQFSLPADEILVESFVCALQKGILHQGRMYVSQHYICFYSNILLSEARLVIRADQIEEVQLARVLIFPTAIRLIHSGGVQSLFASFLSRDKAHALITQVSHGEQIGAQRVKTSEELERGELQGRIGSNAIGAGGKNGPVVRQPTFTDKHQQLLNRGSADKVKSPNSDKTTAASRSSPEKARAPHGGESPRSTSKQRASGRHSNEDHAAGDDVQSQVAKFQRQRPSRTTREEDDDDEEQTSAARSSPPPESTLQRLGSILTAVHVSQPPRAAANSIATAHGVVVIEDDVREVLPSGAKFKHIRTGSLAVGADGPQVAMVDTSPNPANRAAASRGGAAAITMDGHLVVSAGTSRSQNGSPMLKPGNSRTSMGGPSTIRRSPGVGSSREQSDVSDDDHSSSSSSKPNLGRNKSAARQVALAMKPRANGKPRRPRRDSDEEED